MQNLTLDQLKQIMASFLISGRLLEVEEYRIGHINLTYVSSWDDGGQRKRFLHQRINDSIFCDVPGLMRNIGGITRHVNARLLAGKGEKGERALTLVPTVSGTDYICLENLGYWRTYQFLEGTRSFDICPGPAYAFEAAKALGRFVEHLADYPLCDLVQPIARFQDSLFRYEGLEQAIKNNLVGRLSAVQAEIDFAISQKKVACALIEALNSGDVPLRVTHADPKVNNVVFDIKTQEAVAVVDLDTCMAGTVLYDFGDLVRSASVAAAEDEVDLSKVYMSPEYYQALVKGYLSRMQSVLTPRELELLPLAPRSIAITLGVRFLSDYINGDSYFRVKRPNQNLDRARAQFQIARSMQQQEAVMFGAVR